MLSKYIRDLLYRYECVIIPEFGGILTKTISAKIDQDSNTFYPPTKRLAYNSQLLENDGLLANHIASVDKVPYETAVNFIKFEVSQWLKHLKTQDLSLEDIGVFSLNEDKNIVFEPDPNSNFLTDAFGLSAIEAESISRKSVANKDAHIVKREFSYLYKYAAAIAFIFAFGYVGYILYNNNILEKQLAGLEENKEARINSRIQEATFEISNKLPDINIKVQIDQNSSALAGKTNDIEYPTDDNTPDKVVLKQDRIDKALANQTDTSESNNDNTAKTGNNNEGNNSEVVVPANQKAVQLNKVSKANKKVRYHIIGGAFREPANADKKIRQLIAKGYDAQKMSLNKWKLTPVAFGSYDTKQEAQTALNKIRRTETKDAWLLVE